MYYSIPEPDQDVSVPLRLEVKLPDGSRVVNEIFNFRIDDIPDQVFQIPELAPCLTSNHPLIPSMTSSFHAKMEICDRVGWEHIAPLYNLNIHYLQEQKLATYKFSTKVGCPILSSLSRAA